MYKINLFFKFFIKNFLFLLISIFLLFNLIFNPNILKISWYTFYKKLSNLKNKFLYYKSPLPSVYSPTNIYLYIVNIPPIINKQKNKIFLYKQGIPVIKIINKNVYNPTTIAQYGLQKYSYYLLYKKDKYLKEAIRSADWLVENQNLYSGAWEYNFDFKVPGTDIILKSPWISAIAQGQSMSLLVRIYYITKNIKYRKSAEIALKPFLKKVNEGGILSYFWGRPFYEEYPTNPPSFTLNGFMFSLIGLYDMAVILKSNTAKTLFNNGIKTLEFILPFYDLGPECDYHLGHTAYHLHHLFVPKTKVHPAGVIIIPFILYYLKD